MAGFVQAAGDDVDTGCVASAGEGGEDVMAHCGIVSGLDAGACGMV